MKRFILLIFIGSLLFTTCSKKETNPLLAEWDTPFETPPFEKIKTEPGINAADVLGCKVAGVDMIEGPNGPVVLEVNSQPGWMGLQSVTETNIANEIVSYVISELKT